MKKVIPQKIKNVYHLMQAILANFAYGFPSRKIKIIGVTGTNGKTTTSQMIAKILEKAGHKVSLASTINFKLGDKEWVNVTKFTTLSPFSVQRFIQEAVKANCDYLVLETSSHALDQNRVWGISYNTAVITNVTREHLDYHKTMEEYRRAKLKLFKNAETIVVNLDMERPEEFLDCSAKNKFGYTIREQKSVNSNQEMRIIKAEDIKLEIDKSLFTVHCSLFTVQLIGKFNVENALAAICVGLSEGINLETISVALAEIKKVPGRMDSVENKLGIRIIIDYALTPDSMEKIGELMSRTKNSTNKLVWVFGSCGERDRGKRPIMGSIVSRYADYVIVTNEDPYGEDPMQIIKEVASGVKNKKEGKDFWCIFDRREAISAALKISKAGDIILVTGKGAEETMAIGKKRIAWNDRNVIEEELGKI